MSSVLTHVPMTIAALPTLNASGASRAIEVLGDAWVLRILRTSFRGERRFSDYMRALGVSRAVLSERLERMCHDLLLEKVEHLGGHPEYRLTDRGLDLWGVLIAMWQWERHWGTGVDDQAPVHDRPRSRLVHLGCGKAIDPVYACGHCREPVTPFDTFAAVSNEAVPADADAASRSARKRYRKSRSDDRGSLPTLMRAYGDRWNSALIAAALQGKRTFSELSEATGIWPAPLSDRLEELQAMGLMRAKSYAGSRQEYRLTRAAIATYPITVELLQWGDRWLWENRPPMRITHRTCGHALHAHWLCPECGEALSRTSVKIE